MNFLINKEPLAINCDWLSFNVLLNEPEPEINCPDEHRIELLPGNNIFKNRMIVRNAAGEKVLTCLWCPYSSVLNKRIMTCQVANSFLYCDWCSYVKSLLNEIVDCEVNSMSRIDICCDFNATENRLAIIRKLHSGACYVQGKSEGAKWWHNSEFKGKTTQFPHCLNWGTKSSEIKVKLYNKAREQHTDGTKGDADKPYIIDEWKLAGLDLPNVWRLEFSLSGAGQLRYNDRVITLDDVASTNWFCRVFADCLERRFVVRKNQGLRTKRGNQDAKMSFLNFPFERVKIEWKPTEKHNADCDIVTTFRRLLKSLSEPAAQTNEVVFNAISTALREIVYSAHLDMYCDRVLGCSIESYISQLYCHVGCGIDEPDPNPTRMFS